MIWWQVAIVIVVSYFCGNISFSRMIAGAKKQDITKLGSGNPGMTNVLRNYGFKFGLMNLALDMLKSFLPAIISFYVFGESYVMLYIAGVSAIFGHMFPIVYKFKGGKGVSSTIGMFMAANPLATLIMILIGAIVWLIFEYGAVVSFLAMSCLTIIEGLRARATLATVDAKIVCLLLFTVFIFTWYAHRKNIERLLLGKENKASIIKKTNKKLKTKKIKE